MIGYLLGYRTLWFENSAITNVLSLSTATCCFHIQFDNWDDNHIRLSTPIHTVVFNQIRLGLYYHEIKHQYLMLVNTVAENLKGFTKHKFESA